MNGTLAAQVNGTSSDENGALSAATVTATEVVLTVGFLIAMIVASVSAISCVVVVVTRKRRRSTHSQDESGHRVVCMVCSDKFPSTLPPAHASITQEKSEQAYNHSNTLKAITVNEIKSPQIHVWCADGKVIESLYTFDLEDSCNEDEDDEYDDTVHHTRQSSYDDVVYPSLPGYNSHCDHLVDMGTLQSKIDTLTKSYHYYEEYGDVRVDTDHQLQQYPEETPALQSNGYQSLNTASDCDISGDGRSQQDEDRCSYGFYTKPPSATGTLVRELQHMPITKAIKADEV